MYFLDGTRYSSLNTSLTIPSPLISSEEIRGNIPLSTAITTVVNSTGKPTSMVPNFSASLNQVSLSSEDGTSIISSQQATSSMIPIPSVTLRTLVLDLLGIIMTILHFLMLRTKHKT